MTAAGSAVSPRNLAGTDGVGAELRGAEIYVRLVLCCSEKPAQRCSASSGGSAANWEQDGVCAGEHRAVLPPDGVGILHSPSCWQCRAGAVGARRGLSLLPPQLFPAASRGAPLASNPSTLQFAEVFLFFRGSGANENLRCDESFEFQLFSQHGFEGCCKVLGGLPRPAGTAGSCLQACCWACCCVGVLAPGNVTHAVLLLSYVCLLHSCSASVQLSSSN